MEFLLARSLEHFRDAGYAWASLGLAPLANVDTPCGSLLERGIRAVYANPKINATYHYQSLFFFKKKFHPHWRGGYLLFPNALALPQVLAAVVRVHVPTLGSQLLIERICGNTTATARRCACRTYSQWRAGVGQGRVNDLFHRTTIHRLRGFHR